MYPHKGLCVFFIVLLSFYLVLLILVHLPNNNPPENAVAVNKWDNQNTTPPGTLIINCPRDAIFLFGELKHRQFVCVSELVDGWQKATDTRRYLCRQLISEHIPVEGLTKLIVDYEDMPTPNLQAPREVSQQMVFQFCIPRE